MNQENQSDKNQIRRRKKDKPSFNEESSNAANASIHSNMIHQYKIKVNPQQRGGIPNKNMTWKKAHYNAELQYTEEEEH